MKGEQVKRRRDFPCQELAIIEKSESGKEDVVSGFRGGGWADTLLLGMPCKPANPDGHGGLRNRRIVFRGAAVELFRAGQVGHAGSVSALQVSSACFGPSGSQAAQARIVRGTITCTYEVVGFRVTNYRHAHVLMMLIGAEHGERRIFFLSVPSLPQNHAHVTIDCRLLIVLEAPGRTRMEHGYGALPRNPPLRTCF
jgi:hypothetical protein